MKTVLALVRRKGCEIRESFSIWKGIVTNEGDTVSGKLLGEHSGVFCAWVRGRDLKRRSHLGSLRSEK